MKIRPKLIALPVVVSALLSTAVWYGWQWYRTDRFIETTDNAYVKADVIDVRPEITGRIAHVLVRENEIVNAGQPLVEIDPADFRARMHKAQAQLGVARSALKETTARIALQRRRIDAARAGIQAATARRRRAQLALGRARALERKSYESRQRLQDATADDDVAAARLKQARSALDASRRMLAVLKSQRDRARARVQSARADVALAQRQLDKTTISAPHHGVVGDLGAHAGDLARPAVTLLRVVPVPDVYVTANFKETQIDRMSIGQPVTIHVDAFPGTALHGRVASLAPGTGAQFSLLPRDNATGNFNKIVQRVPVRIRVTGPHPALAHLRPGLSVEAAVDTRSAGTRLSYVSQPRGAGPAAKLAAE